MVNKQFFDLPASNPDDDLLDMTAYTEVLAQFILQVDPPFTVGIYGEWGAGKTSFVRFLETSLHTLSKPLNERIKFISFTAWPHKTADELWRALILKIAQELYEV